MGADAEHISPEVRAAISNFLNDVQDDPRPFAISDALRAVRRVFPDLNVSDADLADAVASEASTAGLRIHYDIDQSRDTSSQEGGGNEAGPGEQGNEAARRKSTDTDGAARSARAKRNR